MGLTAAPAARRGSNHEGQDEVDFIAAVRAGDERALQALYARHGGACYALANRLTGDVHLAQDVVQEVFVALWKSPGRYDPRRGDISTWLLTLTHHKSVDMIRREESQQRRNRAMHAEEATAGEHSAGVWDALRRDQVRSALATLSHAQREPLVLAYFGGYTQREIAAMNSTPLGTVKTRMRAGMQRLQELLSDDDSLSSIAETQTEHDEGGANR